VRPNPFIEPCLPTLRKEPPTGKNWSHEVKFDGYRIQVHKQSDEVCLFSKNGADFTRRFDILAHIVRDLPVKRFILDAEITAVREDDDSPDFSALLHRKDTDLCLWVFDLLALNQLDMRHVDLAARRKQLQGLMPKIEGPLIRYSETFTDPHALLKVCGDRRMEGIVSKQLDKPYVSGTSKDWVKVKCADWREENQWRHEFFGKNR
jgi:bifunctional non-homologous end joining protein LigD